MQHPSHQCGMQNSVNPYDARRQDVRILQSQQHHWDLMSHQIAPVAGSANGYTSPQYTTSNPIFPYHELPPHFANEVNSGNLPYYLGNSNYIPVPYLSPQHVDIAENGAASSSYPQHFYSTAEPYPLGHSPTNGQSFMYSQPMMYPQYHVPPPSPHMQEQWNPTMGPQLPYAPQCVAPPSGPVPIVEPSLNGQCPIPKGSL